MLILLPLCIPTPHIDPHIPYLPFTPLVLFYTGPHRQHPALLSYYPHPHINPSTPSLLSSSGHYRQYPSLLWEWTHGYQNTYEQERKSTPHEKVRLTPVPSATSPFFPYSPTYHPPTFISHLTLPPSPLTLTLTLPPYVLLSHLPPFSYTSTFHPIPLPTFTLSLTLTLPLSGFLQRPLWALNRISLT